MYLDTAQRPQARQSNQNLIGRGRKLNMKVFVYWKTQVGIGFAVWESGAEIFLPYIMIRLMYKGNNLLRMILRLRI